MSTASGGNRLKPTATATITPMTRRAAALCGHLIEVVVKLSEKEAKRVDPNRLEDVVRAALGDLPPGTTRRKSIEAPASTPSRRGGSSAAAASSIETSVVYPGRPPDGLVEQLRRALDDAGYRVTVREKRECAEPACSTGVMVDWNRLSQVPPGWFNSLICGAHHYRQCSKCSSTYRMSSTNSSEPAPSVHCQVCGGMMVEWGSSKIWQAELVTTGT